MEALPLAAAAMLGGVDVSAAVILNFPGNFERTVVQYHCEGLDPFAVTYVNAAPNFLAIVPVDGKNLIFVTVLSGSGAKYAAGEYEWWTKGSDATLANLTTPDAAPVTCSEATETP
jgi:membrane-bound inhibitor of C-type lysozyme